MNIGEHEDSPEYTFAPLETTPAPAEPASPVTPAVPVEEPASV